MSNERKIEVLKALGWSIKIVPQNDGTVQYFGFEGAAPPHFDKYENCTDETVWAHQIEVGGFDTDVTDDAAYLHLLMSEGVKWAREREWEFVLTYSDDTHGNFEASFNEYLYDTDHGPEMRTRLGKSPDPATAIESALSQIIQEEGK